ncbi:zinc finger protein 428 isoform X1 [Antechinus flavipes]|uniref:zinc finger protein 428 isoform X1 n=1 Tax=Antechinus flavipes TaxID=38775 RepID=UPI002236AFC1|nr:zinc finger protein 428 isoform X1 [Antechinus flavipes]
MSPEGRMMESGQRVALQKPGKGVQAENWGHELGRRCPGPGQTRDKLRPRRVRRRDHPRTRGGVLDIARPPPRIPPKSSCACSLARTTDLPPTPGSADPKCKLLRPSAAQPGGIQSWHPQGPGTCVDSAILPASTGESRCGHRGPAPCPAQGGGGRPQPSPSKLVLRRRRGPACCRRRPERAERGRQGCCQGRWREEALPWKGAGGDPILPSPSPLDISPSW